LPGSKRIRPTDYPLVTIKMRFEKAPGTMTRTRTLPTGGTPICINQINEVNAFANGFKFDGLNQRRAEFLRCGAGTALSNQRRHHQQGYAPVAANVQIVQRRNTSKVSSACNGSTFAGGRPGACVNCSRRQCFLVTETD
jgi:hypothetical protein